MRTMRAAGAAAVVVVIPGLMVAAVARAGDPPDLTPFTEEAVARGVVYAQVTYKLSGALPYGHQGFGIGFADLDADADPDLILMGKADKTIGLFENDGTGHFTDRSATSGMQPQAEVVGFSPADYDGDGDLDIYITNLASPQDLTLENVLYRNEGNFTFTDVTDAAGVGGGLGDSNGASWADYNGDGWLDLYVANYNGISGTPGSSLVSNILFRNNGNGTFTDVSVEQTVNDDGYSFLGQWSDIDRDGDPDLYVSNDRGHLPPKYKENQLWRNDNGQMVNISAGSGADLALFSMGVACGDFDRNGFPDFYCTNIGNYAQGFNPLLLNQGDNTFVEFSDPAGVDQYVSSWGTVFFDFDNDADLDVYVNNMFAANMLHLNPGLEWPCVNVAPQLGVQSLWGLKSAADLSYYVSYTSAVGDADGDGNIDLLCGTASKNIDLFINHEGQERNHIRFNVRGLWPNLFAIGANAELTAGGITQFHEIYASGNGYLGQNELTQHFGIGAETHAQSATITWPGGSPIRTFTHIPAGTWTILPPQQLGDSDHDGDVELDDFLACSACYGAEVLPGCEVMDFDGNFHINEADFAAFLNAFTSPLEDCDGNGIPDIQQILFSGGDANGDGLLDDCGGTPCPADLSGDGAIGSSDLNLVLGGFGCTVAPCNGDIDGDGDTDSGDLNLLLAGFGTVCE